MGVRRLGELAKNRLHLLGRHTDCYPSLLQTSPSSLIRVSHPSPVTAGTQLRRLDVSGAAGIVCGARLVDVLGACPLLEELLAYAPCQLVAPWGALVSPSRLTARTWDLSCVLSQRELERLRLACPRLAAGRLALQCSLDAAAAALGALPARVTIALLLTRADADALPLFAMRHGGFSSNPSLGPEMDQLPAARPDQLAAVCGDPRLEALCLSRLGLAHASEVAALAAALAAPGCGLAALDLSDCDVGPAEATSLAAGLAANASLTCFVAAQTMSAGALEALLPALGSICSLRSLDLRGCTLPRNAAQALFSDGRLPALAILNLGDIARDDLFESLVQGVAQSSSLTALGVREFQSNTGPYSDFIAEFADVFVGLFRNPLLQTLSLSDVQMNTTIFTSIAVSPTFSAAASLCTLDLSNTRIDGASAFSGVCTYSCKIASSYLNLHSEPTWYDFGDRRCDVAAVLTPL